MKKTYLLMAAVLLAVTAKAEVEFAYEAGAELVSAYLWHGQYNGGLSFQPTVSVGYEGDHTAFNVGAWASVGASDWKFQKGLEETEDGNPNTYFVPELDLTATFSTYGLSVGVTHYYYGDKQFFARSSMDKNLEEGLSSQLEITAGYDFSELTPCGLFINWNTMLCGNDFIATEWDENEEEINWKRAYSSYLEIGYAHEFEKLGLTLTGIVGMSPWASAVYMNDRFAVVNLDLRLEKAFDLGLCSLSLFAEGCVNPYGIRRDKQSVYLNTAGDDKLYCQTLNGTVGLGIWF